MNQDSDVAYTCHWPPAYDLRRTEPPDLAANRDCHQRAISGSCDLQPASAHSAPAASNFPANEMRILMRSRDSNWTR